MIILWLIIPPWLLAVIVTFIGRWGERHFTHSSPSNRDVPQWVSLVNILIANLLFLALLPVSVLSLFGPLLPFSGPQSGLALAIAVILFGLAPARMLDATRTGWDHAFWTLFVDIVRVGGSLTLTGWLLSR